MWLSYLNYYRRDPQLQFSISIYLPQTKLDSISHRISIYHFRFIDRSMIISNDMNWHSEWMEHEQKSDYLANTYEIISVIIIAYYNWLFLIANLIVWALRVTQRTMLVKVLAFRTWYDAINWVLSWVTSSMPQFDGAGGQLFKPTSHFW